jgi:hypothetical protein
MNSPSTSLSSLASRKREKADTALQLETTTCEAEDKIHACGASGQNFPKDPCANVRGAAETNARRGRKSLKTEFSSLQECLVAEAGGSTRKQASTQTAWAKQKLYVREMSAEKKDSENPKNVFMQDSACDSGTFDGTCHGTPFVLNRKNGWRERYSGVCEACFAQGVNCEHYPEIPLKLLVLGKYMTFHSTASSRPGFNFFAQRLPWQ